MSLQLSRYCAARLADTPIEVAAATSGLGIECARLWEKSRDDGEADFEALSRAGAHAHAHEGDQGETVMEEFQTSIRVGDGPEVPIDLGNDIDDPTNTAAKGALSGLIERALDKSATDTGQRLKLYVERVERLDEEIKGLNEDKSDLFKEMKSNGFDTKTIKRIIKLRKMGSHERQEAESLIQTYMDAIGMTPIEAAIALAA